MSVALATVGAGVSSGMRLALAPLQSLVSFFAPWQRPVKAAPVNADQAAIAMHSIAAQAQPERLSGSNAMRWQGRHGAHGLQAHLAASHAIAAHVAPKLRVLRVPESHAPRHNAVRMRISGRMADVCAELERLACQELA